MLKVKLVPMTLMVPVIDNSGDHDCKIEQQDFDEICLCISRISVLSPGDNYRHLPVELSEQIGHVVHNNRSAENVRQGAWQNAIPRPSEVLRDAADIVTKNSSFIRETVSQIDPPIDTTVRDSEMRSTAPEMSLDEFRERPERTKTPPRPRANSWRHE